MVQQRGERILQCRCGVAGSIKKLIEIGQTSRRSSTQPVFSTKFVSLVVPFQQSKVAEEIIARSISGTSTAHAENTPRQVCLSQGYSGDVKWRRLQNISIEFCTEGTAV